MKTQLLRGFLPSIGQVHVGLSVEKTRPLAYALLHADTDEIVALMHQKLKYFLM